MLVIEPVETYVYAYCIYRAVTYTECQISRNITRNLLAILIFTDSLFELCVELSLQASHCLYYITVSQNCLSSICCSG